MVIILVCMGYQRSNGVMSSTSFSPTAVERLDHIEGPSHGD